MKSEKEYQITKEQLEEIISTIEAYDQCLAGEWNSGISDSQEELVNELRKLLGKQ